MGWQKFCRTVCLLLGGVAASGVKDVKADSEGSPKADVKDGKGEVSKENTHPSKGEEDAVMSDDDVNSALGTGENNFHLFITC